MPRSIVIALCLLVMLAADPVTAGDKILLVDLGSGRHLVARESREGVVLHFLGERSTLDDTVLLLPDHYYPADARWLEDVGTVVVAAAQSEAPAHIYGFDRDGRRRFRHRSVLEEGTRLLPLPGDSLVVASSYNLARPPIVLHGRTGELQTGFLDWPHGNKDERGRPVWRQGNFHVFDPGLAVMADRRMDVLVVSAQALEADGPMWEGVVAEMSGAREGAASERRIFLAGGIFVEPVLFVSFDRQSGEVLASAQIRGTSAKLIPEPKGDRLLAIVCDTKQRGRLLLLDQATLAVRDSLPNPEGWFVPEWTPPARVSKDGSVSLVPAPIIGHFGKERPRSLVVFWGDQIGVHWLEHPATLAVDGGVLIAHIRNLEGSRREIRVKRWSPPHRPPTH